MNSSRDMVEHKNGIKSESKHNILLHLGMELVKITKIVEKFCAWKKALEL